jgi:hypothetical protein
MNCGEHQRRFDGIFIEKFERHFKMVGRATKRPEFECESIKKREGRKEGVFRW